jgi:hypothetical protein
MSTPFAYVSAAGNSGAGQSAGVWKDMPESIRTDRNVGYFWFDDFLHFQDPTTAKNYGPYKVLDTGDCTLTEGAVAGGVLKLLTTTDNEDCGICLGNGAAPFVISDTAGKKLWFEAKVKKSIITDAKAGFFVGLADETALAANFIADAGNDFGDNDLIGFWCDETDDSTGAHVHFVYQITGQDFVTKIDTVATLTADTWVKLGFVYDPAAEDTKKIKIFVDGVEQSTYVTAANIAAATFPDGEELTPIFYANAASNDDVTASMDWWQIAQLAA